MPICSVSWFPCHHGSKKAKRIVGARACHACMLSFLAVFLAVMVLLAAGVMWFDYVCNRGAFRAAYCSCKAVFTRHVLPIVRAPLLGMPSSSHFANPCCLCVARVHL